MSEQHYNLAFVFPGQGSQAIGMLSALAAHYPVVEKVFGQASEVLGFDLWKLVQEGPIELLNETYNTQPAMLAAGVAMWQVWCQQTDIRPAWMAGHSLGEYTALVCAQALNFTDAIALVAERGRLMQEAVPVGTGGMAAIIGLEDHQVVNICAQVAEGEVVSAVNFNAPGQVVVAGINSAVERVMLATKQAGAKLVVKLPVSVPSHCALMKTAAEKLNAKLQTVVIDTPNVTLIHNVDVAAHSSAEVIRNALREQLFKPVRWVDGIKFMHDQGVTHFVEVGPGKVLLALNKRIVKTANHFALYDPESLKKTLEQLNG